jgi:DNA mismatch endonuclease, patch repair protein
MSDHLSRTQRSANMAAVRSKDTQPELLVRRSLHAAGFRFRLHVRDLPGNPDVVLPRLRYALFVHGCFWHGHYCKRGNLPTTNVAFWSKKIETNLQRDAAARRPERLGQRAVARPRSLADRAADKDK